MSDKQAMMQRAIEFGNSPDLFNAFNAATLDRDLWAKAQENADKYVRSQGLELPEGFHIQFLGDPYYPGPDFELFTIQLFNCRRMWVKKRNAPGYEQVEVCFGFELVPHVIPGGPLG